MDFSFIGFAMEKGIDDDGITPFFEVHALSVYTHEEKVVGSVITDTEVYRSAFTLVLTKPFKNWEVAVFSIMGLLSYEQGYGMYLGPLKREITSVFQ